MAKIYGIDVGDWYQITDGRVFRIVSIDNDDETLEVQYVDGDIEEIEVDYWYDLEPEPVDGPPRRGAMPYDSYLDRDNESEGPTLSDLLGSIEYNH